MNNVFFYIGGISLIIILLYIIKFVFLSQEHEGL